MSNMKVKMSFFRCCILACIMAFGVACSNQGGSSGKFTIKGKLSDVDDGVVISLLGFENDTVRNGRFEFAGEAGPDAELLGLMVIDDGPISMPLLAVWIAPGAKIKINGKGKLTPLWTVQSSVPNQKEENLYTNENRDNIAEQARINIELIDLLTKSRAASSEDQVLAYREVSNFLMTKLDSLKIREIYSNISVMEKTAVSPIWLNKMNGLAGILFFRKSSLSAEQSGYLIKKAWELYNKMSEEDKNTPIGNQILRSLEQL